MYRIPSSPEASESSQRLQQVHMASKQNEDGTLPEQFKLWSRTTGPSTLLNILCRHVEQLSGATYVPSISNLLSTISKTIAVAEDTYLRCNSKRMP